MPVGVVLTLGSAYWSIATATDILLVEWRWKKDAVRCYLYSGDIISDMSADTVTLSNMPACTVQHYQTCMLGSFIQICELVKCCSIRQDIWSVTNPSGMPTGRVPLPQV